MINPIDSNSDFENSGSIFAIFRRNSTRFKGLGREDLYQTGEKLLASGYCFYG
jgi:fructose-1,6-bisphosphatase